ncbi:MAG: OB-fold nucleic acid binding domain-containing protein, partial [Thermoplasmata archaeon]
MTVSKIRTCQEATIVTGRFAIRSKELPRDYKNKDGKFFFFEVGDRTGNILVKYWGGSDGEKTVELFNSLKVGDLVEISGVLEKDKYDGRLGITINEGANKLERLGRLGSVTDLCGKEGASDFIKASDKIEECFLKLKAYANSINDSYLRALVLLFLEDSTFCEAFKTVPGTSLNHHNYIGGNIEHTLAVTELCIKMCEMHPLDRDLLVSA